MSEDQNISEIIKTVADYARPEIVERDGSAFAIIRAPGEGGAQSVVDLDPMLAKNRDRPRRIETAIDVRTPASLAAYMNLYADANHMAFVRVTEPYAVRVVLDYHEADSVGGNEPRWQGHSISMRPLFTPSYSAWRGRHRVESSQSSTMEFCEDRMVDVVSPDAADIMDMVLNFESLTKVSFSSKQRLRDGRVQFSYKEDEADSGRVTVHEEMRLLIPIFEGAEPEPITIRIRTRVKDGELFFVFVVANIEELERAAFMRLCDVWRTSFNACDLREISV